MHRLLALPCCAVLLFAACDTGDASRGEDAGSLDDEEEVSVLGARVSAGLSYDEAVETAIAEIDDFWDAHYAALYGTPYTTVEDVEAVGPGDEVECGGERGTYRDVKGNAFYCPTDDRIVYDDATLFPALHEQFGGLAVAAVLAHEWGHAVQQRSGFRASGAAAIALELQADCFAGAWVAHVRLSSDDPFDVEPPDLHAALSGYLQFRDEPRGAAPVPDAPGTAFDRLNAFQEGFEQGTLRCAAFSDPVSLPQVFEVAFSSRVDARRAGDTPVPDAAQDVGDDLNAYWASRIPGFQAVGLVALDGRGGSRCGGESVPTEVLVDPAAYCSADRSVLYDEVVLGDIHDEIGDGAGAASLSDAWARAAAESLGFRIEGDEFDLTLDCLSGTWAGDVTTAKRPDALLQVSPGDLDEIVAALLASETLRESDRDLSAFDRVSAFRAGFLALANDEASPPDACRRFL